MARTHKLTDRFALGGLALAATVALASIAATSVLTSATLAQGGYSNDPHPDLGLVIPRAAEYEELPVAPGEKWIVLHYVERLGVVQREKRTVRPELFVLSIERDPAPEPDTIPPVPDVKTKGKPPTAQQKPKPKKPIDSLESYLEQRTSWRLGAGIMARSGIDRERAGWTSAEYELLAATSDDSEVAGWAYTCTDAERTIALLGFCAESNLEQQSKIWRYCGDRMRISAPEELSLKDLERYYARTKLAQPEFRIGVRSKLVRGWKSKDLEHFIVIYDTADQMLMRRICRDVELLREEYVRLFPPEGELDAVSTIRVCKERSEYLAYSGMPSTAGFWNVEAGELVLYDAERKFKSDDPDTFIALYHEAFHQYIHYSAGEVEPHSWFDEGHGDYFSGAQISDGKLRGIGLNPWRLPVIKAVLEARKSVPWKDILRMEQAGFYKSSALCYAQAWSMIYFLRTSDVVEKRQTWARILPAYFQTLKSAWREESTKLEASGRLRDPQARALGQLDARKRALEAAIKDVDLDEIERAWRKFVLEL